MKTPTNIGGNDLAHWLQTATEIRMADLYTITLKAGGVFRYTTWDSSLVVSGNTFLTGPPNIDRTSIEEKLGMDVSTIEVTIEASLTDLVNGVPILQAIGLGLFDGAAFKIERLFMDSAGQQIGTVVRFAGFIGAVDELTRSSAKIQVEAGTKLLQMDLPAILLQPGCTNTLFDARCTLSKTNMLVFSEQFDNAAWVKTTGVTVTPNVIADPLGGLTGDRVSYDGSGSSGSFRIYQTPVSSIPAVGVKMTSSIWLRCESGTVSVRLANNGGFAIQTCALTTTWQRFSVTGTGDGTSINQLLIYSAAADNSAFTIDAWGAQLEFGAAVTAYSSTAGSAGFTELNTVQSGSTVNKLISLSAKTDGYFDNGQISFISGVNAGLVKAVKIYAAQKFTFNSPLPFPPSAGDTFIAYPGCDKMQATCANKFGNLQNFEGMPYVPVPETAL